VNPAPLKGNTEKTEILKKSPLITVPHPLAMGATGISSVFSV
jgi:hypothetical protein